MIDIKKLLGAEISILGKELTDWINQDKNTKDAEELYISNKLYHKYLSQTGDGGKPNVFPDAFYFVKKDDKLDPENPLIYLVRDRVKSPRSIPEKLVNLKIVDVHKSFKGSLIQDWAYYQNSNSNNPFYMEGCDIVTKYLSSNHPIHNDVYYYVNKVNGYTKLFRDLKKSPRKQ